MANTNHGFNIHGDEITYEGIRFATIDGKCLPTLRAEAEGGIIHGPDDWISQADADAAADQQYENGERDAREECHTVSRGLVELLKDAVASLESHEDPDDEALCNQIRSAIRQIKDKLTGDTIAP